MAYRLIIEENTIYEIDEGCEAAGQNMFGQQIAEENSQKSGRNRELRGRDSGERFSKD